MSYDLMVFAASAAPKQRVTFLKWYDQQTVWEEEHHYDDPEVTTPELRSWLMEIIQSFPRLEKYKSLDELSDDVSPLTGYAVGKSVIYATFSWSKVEPAHRAAFDLAAKHGVGFYDVSGTGEVWLPNGTGGLVLAFVAKA